MNNNESNVDLDTLKKKKKEVHLDEIIKFDWLPFILL